MKNAIIIILCSLFIAGCSSHSTSSDSKWVDNNLQGEWERTEAAFYPEGQSVITETGKLKLTFNTITITGPFSNLQGYTRNTALEAYTDEGKLYIKDIGEWQTPIPYTYWESGGYPPSNMLTLRSSGVAAETLKKMKVE